jgi:hypothetical protein
MNLLPWDYTSGKTFLEVWNTKKQVELRGDRTKIVQSV